MSKPEEVQHSALQFLPIGAKVYRADDGTMSAWWVGGDDGKTIVFADSDAELTKRVLDAMAL